MFVVFWLYGSGHEKLRTDSQTFSLDHSNMFRLRIDKIPRVGGAEKLKLQEAIPPFSLIEDSIHGMSADMLV